MGHATEAIAAPPIDYQAFVRAHIGILCTHIALAVDARLAVLRRGLRDDDLEPAILDGYRRARGISATDYAGMIQGSRRPACPCISTGRGCPSACS
ncbi:amidase [Bordetella pertussis]|nr:hypothetical protein [Bordetella pertussis]CFE04109.1 amidase [Bordetella pertussis]